MCLENLRHQPGQRNEKANESEQLHAVQAEVRRKEEGPGRFAAAEKGGSQAGQDD